VPSLELGNLGGSSGFPGAVCYVRREASLSSLILAGAPLKDVKEMIGHGDIAMTDRYSHLTMERRRFNQQQLTGHYAVESESEVDIG